MVIYLIKKFDININFITVGNHVPSVTVNAILGASIRSILINIGLSVKMALYENYQIQLL